MDGALRQPLLNTGRISYKCINMQRTCFVEVGTSVSSEVRNHSRTTNRVIHEQYVVMDTFSGEVRSMRVGSSSIAARGKLMDVDIVSFPVTTIPWQEL